MNYIQFESAREKEKARNDLWEAREEMLHQARKRAEHGANKQLKGEINWMLPSVEDKLKRRDSEFKKAKKKNKSKLKKTEKMICTNSEEESTLEDEDNSLSDEVPKKHKKSNKFKKKHKGKSKSRINCISDSSGEESKKPKALLHRDIWMTDALMFKTYSRERVGKPNEKQQIDTYDPIQSSRELNSFWKTTGTGLPAFRKPLDDDDQNTKARKSSISLNRSSKVWKKHNDKEILYESKLPAKEITHSSSDYTSSSEEKPKVMEKETVKPTSTLEFLTDHQMNELGAKVLKAEIMGDMSLADELRQKLENARIQRTNFKERKKSEFVGDLKATETKIFKSSKNKEEHILLTHTNQTGQARPLPSTKAVDPRDLYGGKKKSKRVETHDGSGQRVRYFADDDRYDIKQMFQSAKYTSAFEANLQFADIAGKHKNPNDDLEDIFAEKVCQDDSARLDRNNRDRAIREHQNMEKALDNCDKCFDSIKMQKELLVSVGEKVYLALPWYQGLQLGHCMIIPSQHSTCCTQLDEDTWSEVNDFRKALTRMFAAQRKDVIFFEIANRLYKRPHLVIHCVPIKESDGEMAPFYFKKAIEESEHEWCVNKQLVSLRGKSLRSSIPKGLPYFWVNFGMQTGFAHVIEEEQRFPVNFAQEIIGGMLHLDANKWRKLQKEQNIITKVEMFADWWKKYDCTK